METDIGVRVTSHPRTEDAIARSVYSILPSFDVGAVPHPASKALIIAPLGDKDRTFDLLDQMVATGRLE